MTILILLRETNICSSLLPVHILPLFWHIFMRFTYLWCCKFHKLWEKWAPLKLGDAKSGLTHGTTTNGFARGWFEWHTGPIRVFHNWNSKQAWMMTASKIFGSWMPKFTLIKFWQRSPTAKLEWITMPRYIRLISECSWILEFAWISFVGINLVFLMQI